MLKRKGELCRRKVPGFPGLLTDSEHKAYVEIIEYVKKDIQHCNFCRNVIAEIENQIPQLKELADKTVPQRTDVVTDGGCDEWQILHTFPKIEKFVDLLFCSQQKAGTRYFSVLARDCRMPQLDCSYRVFDTNPSLVLEHFLDNQRYGFGILKNKLELRIAGDLFKKHPADVCRRVCKAVAPLYDKQTAIENENAPAEKMATGVKMKL